jgi:hypothetical protein
MRQENARCLHRRGRSNYLQMAQRTRMTPTRFLSRRTR